MVLKLRQFSANKQKAIKTLARSCTASIRMVERTRTFLLGSASRVSNCEPPLGPSQPYQAHGPTRRLRMTSEAWTTSLGPFGLRGVHMPLR